MTTMKRFLGIALLLVANVSFAARYALDYRPVQLAHQATAAKASYASAPPVENVVRETRLAPTEMPAVTGDLAVGDRLVLRLFADAEVEVTLTRALPAGLVGRSFEGRVAGGDEAMRTAVVLQTADGLQVHVGDPAASRTFVVASSAQGGVVREMASVQGDCSSDTLLPAELAPVTDPLPASDVPLSNTGSSVYVDLLLVYDLSAATWALQNGYGLLEFAQLQVDKMNLALGNTYLTDAFSFRLKGVKVLNGSLGTSTGNAVQYAMLGQAYNGVETKPIHTWRDEAGADIVCVLIDTGSATGTTGTGYSLTNYSKPSYFASSAYNATAIRAVTGAHTMTHEVGHNMGAGHSDMVADAGNRGPQSYSYSSGYYYTGSDGVGYHTIMSYNTDGYGNYYTGAPYFSSPYYYYKGHAVGDASHNNTQALRNLCSAVAGFRAEVPVAPEDVVLYNVFFSPEDGAVIDGSLSVTLTSASSAAVIRYTLDGSAPTASSPVYTAPLKLAKTTTVRAASFVSGTAGPVYSATYYLNDLGAGLDASDLTWTTSADYPWQFAVDKTHDGVDAVRSGGISGHGTSHLKTTVIGPGTLRFQYCKSFYSAAFEVHADDELLYEDTTSTSANNKTWTEVSLSVGSGEHELDFSYTHNGTGWSGCFNGVHLDQLSWSGRVPVAVTFNAGGGTCAVTSRRYAQGDTYGTLPVPTRTGYTFTGWYVPGGLRITAESVVTPGTCYARWLAKSYVITFDANGGASSTTLTRTYGSSLGTLPAASRTGHTFIGWFTAASGGTRVSEATVVRGATTYYAHWAANRYSVQFSANGGRGTQASLTCTYGQRATLPTGAFSRKGYRFAGWSTKPSGGVAYGDGATVLNLTSAHGGKVTLYAVWEERREPELFPEGDASAMDASASQTYVGWLRDADGTVCGTLTAKVAKPRVDRTTGATSAKVSVSTVTENGKGRASAVLSNGQIVADSREGVLKLRFAGMEMKGSLGPYEVTGARNVFVSRDGASKALAAELMRDWRRTFAVVNPTSAGYDILSVTVNAKGKTKVAGTLADGTRISAASQLLAGDGICAVPVFYSKRGRTVAFTLWLGDPYVASGLSATGFDEAIVGYTGDVLGARVDFGTLPAGYVRLTDARDEAWKVRLTPRTGAVKGSFKLATMVNGREKKVTVSVSGILVGDTAYCTAGIRKVGAWLLTIQ